MTCRLVPVVSAFDAEIGLNDLQPESIPEIPVAQPLSRQSIDRTPSNFSLFDIDVVPCFDLCDSAVSAFDFVMHGSGSPSERGHRGNSCPAAERGC